MGSQLTFVQLTQGLGIFAFLILCYGTVLIYLRVPFLHRYRTPNSIPHATFIGTMATAWALTLGFLASDIWALGARADQAIATEQTAITRLWGAAHPEALDNPRIVHALEVYISSLNNEEMNADGFLSQSEMVDRALHTIRIEVIRTNNSRSDLTSFRLTEDFDNLENARNERLAIAVTSVDLLRWYLVLVFTFLTLFAIGVCHGDRPPAGRVAMLLYATGAGVCLWILAIHANPFQNTMQLHLPYQRLHVLELPTTTTEISASVL